MSHLGIRFILTCVAEAILQLTSEYPHHGGRRPLATIRAGSPRRQALHRRGQRHQCRRRQLLRLHREELCDRQEVHYQRLCLHRGRDHPPTRDRRADLQQVGSVLSGQEIEFLLKYFQDCRVTRKGGGRVTGVQPGYDDRIHQELLPAFHP